jgi:hypothetical protein
MYIGQIRLVMERVHVGILTKVNYSRNKWDYLDIRKKCHIFVL